MCCYLHYSKSAGGFRVFFWIFSRFFFSYACLRSSALSQLDFRVNRLQFRSGVVDLHLPIDAALRGVDVGGPSVGFRTQCRHVGESAARDALAGQGTQFVFGDVQPTAVLGRVAELDAADQ